MTYRAPMTETAIGGPDALIIPGERVLITTNNWFYGPDGREYHAAWGTVRGVRSDEESLGIKTNRNATNWYAEVGNMTIAGCQIFYVVKCDQVPPNEAECWTTHEGTVVRNMRPSCIYNADAQP